MAGIVISAGKVIPFVAPISVISNKPVFSGDTMSLQRNTNGQVAQRWEIKANIFPSNSNADFFVHGVVNNFDGVFDIQMPQPYRGHAFVKNTSNISAVGTAGNFSVTISGNTGTLYKGDFVRFTTHNKTYMITADITGNGAMNIFPQLRKDVNATMEHSDGVNFKATYDSTNVLGMVYTDGVLSDPGTLTFIEAP